MNILNNMFVLLVISYLIGSVPFAILISKAMNLADPRSYGSNNAGATNILRSGNKFAALLTLLGDGLKGFLVVVGAEYWSRHFYSLTIHHIGSGSIIALCGVMVVLGHIYPVFFKFKGGKGVATSVGVILAFNSLLALLLLVTWVIVFALKRISSLAAIVATISLPIYAYLIMGHNVYFGACLLIAIVVLYKHKTNLIRLLTNQEHKFTK